jgi:hypothetical protein
MHSCTCLRCEVYNLLRLFDSALYSFVNVYVDLMSAYVL